MACESLSVIQSSVHMLDLFFQTPVTASVPPPADPQRPPKKEKKKKKPSTVPRPVDGSSGSRYHASFTPLPPEPNIPEATADPFQQTFAGVGGEEDELLQALVDQDCLSELPGNEWEYEDQVGGDEDAESWGATEGGVYADADDDDSAHDDDVCSGSSPMGGGTDPLELFFQRRRSHSLKEQRIVYSGPQLVCDESSDESSDG